MPSPVKFPLESGWEREALRYADAQLIVQSIRNVCERTSCVQGDIREIFSIDVSGLGADSALGTSVISAMPRNQLHLTSQHKDWSTRASRLLLNLIRLHNVEQNLTRTVFHEAMTSAKAPNTRLVTKYGAALPSSSPGRAILFIIRRVVRSSADKAHGKDMYLICRARPRRLRKEHVGAFSFLTKYDVRMIRT
ncbi:MAG TPA: hypothetical protein DD739_12320 [Ochrobactrum anthropi]|jgi:hypothetical protein|nr:hypothetical protein [Brucella anthropi]